MKNLKLCLQVVVLLSLFCVFTETVQAQSFCKDIFVKKSSSENPYYNPELNRYDVRITKYNTTFLRKKDLRIIKKLENAVNSMNASKTIREYNDAQYTTVVTANEILDILVQNFMTLDHSNVDPIRASAISGASVHIADKLMEIFKIPASALSNALIARVGALKAEIHAIVAAGEIRQPIGFVTPKIETVKTEEVIDIEMLNTLMKMLFEDVGPGLRKQKTIGFVQKEKTEDPVRKPEEKRKMDQIGFIRSQRSSEKSESVEKIPVGFIPADRLVEDSLEPTYQVIFNVNTGYFDRLKSFSEEE